MIYIGFDVDDLDFENNFVLPGATQLSLSLYNSRHSVDNDELYGMYVAIATRHFSNI